MNPIFAQRRLSAADRLHYRSCAAQREYILLRLRQGPATREELAALGVPSPTKRVSELRARGWPIGGEALSVATTDGDITLTVRYSLALDAQDPRQFSLPGFAAA